MGICSFKSKLILSVICILSAILLGKGALNYHQMYTMIRNELSESMLRTTKAVASELDTWLESRLKDAMATAVLPAAKAINTDGFAAIDKVNHERYKLFEKLLPGEFSDFYAAGNDYIFHAITDKNGEMQVNIGNLFGRKYYERIMNGGDAHITQPLISRATQAPTFFVVAPIVADGKPQGLVGAGITLDFLQKRIKTLQYGKTGYGTVLSQEGYFLAHPKTSLLMTTNYKDIEPKAQSLGTAMLTGTSGSLEYEYSGIQKTGFYHPIPAAGWSLAFVIDNSELYAPAQRTLELFIVSTIASILLTLVALLPIIGRMTAPLEQLKAYAGKVAHGNFVPMQELQADHEFQDLAHSLNTMSTQLDTLFTELEHTRDHLDKMINAIPVALVSIDFHGKLTMFNNAANAIASRPPVEGKSLHDCFFIPEAVERTILANIQQNKKFHMPQYRLETPGSPHKIFSISAYPLQTRTDGVVAFEDITDKNRMEEIVMQSEKMLSVGNLAAGMAHEINNPLGGILQGAQNIFRRLDPSRSANTIAAEKRNLNLDDVNLFLEDRKITRMLRGIQESAERAAKIVGSMLSFAQRDHNTLVQHDLNELVSESLRLAKSDYTLMNTLDFKDINIETHLDTTLPTIPCASSEIEQVMLGLVQNAAYALSSGGSSGDTPSITISTLQKESHAVVIVEDNGPGMPDAVRKRVFEPFFTTKKPGEGTGLGLAVAYFVITQNHQGSIIVEEGDTGGTRFVIELPFKRAGASL